MDREMHREQLISVVEKVLKRLTAQVMTPKNVSSVIRKAVGRKADRDRLENAVTKTNEEFTNTAIEEVQELIDEHDVEARVGELIELCKNTDPNAKGWRPTRRPELDVLGHTRITLQNHVERLEEIKQDYVSQLEEKKRYCEQLKEQIKELDDGSLFASKVDGFQL